MDAGWQSCVSLRMAKLCLENKGGKNVLAQGWENSVFVRAAKLAFSQGGKTVPYYGWENFRRQNSRVEEKNWVALWRVA